MADEEKEEYFYRLVRLVVNLGTEGLLKVFLKEINRQTIQNFLESQRTRIDTLKQRHVLNEAQYKILQDRIEGRNENEFDISLLCVLIRNLTSLQDPLGGWNTQCLVPSDQSPGANVVRLKSIRNEAIAHVTKCCMKKSQFETIWARTEVVLLGLAQHYGEEDIMRSNIDQAKTKELIEEEKGQLDKLLKWTFEETYAEMLTKIEELDQKIANQDSIPEEISGIKADIGRIQQQLKQSGMINSSEDQSSLEVTPVAGGSPQTAEVDVLRHSIRQMEHTILSHMNEILRDGNPYSMQQTDPPEPPITNPDALRDQEIEKYAAELGSNWEIFAVYLGYRQVQIEILNQTYPRQIETKLYKMLKKWHDVVARCDENPQKLLAAAFTNIGNNKTAFKILGNRELVEDVKTLKPKPETETKIQKIKFEHSLTSIGAPVVNVKFGDLQIFQKGCFSQSGPINFSNRHDY